AGNESCTNRLVPASGKEWNMNCICKCVLWRRCALPVLALASVCWLVPGEAATQQQREKLDQSPAAPQQTEKRDLKRDVEKREMPAPAAPKTEMRVFQLKYVKAGDLAQTMQQIWRQRLGPGFSVGVDFRSNSVIVTAGSQDMAMLDALISKL